MDTLVASPPTMDIRKEVLNECHLQVKQFLQHIDEPKTLGQKFAIQQQHNLCISLVVNYVSLVQKLEVMKEADSSTEVGQLMSTIFTYQKCMKALCYLFQNTINQQILTRTFLDCLLSWNKDLEEEKGMKEKPVAEVSLLTENVKYGGPQSSFKFRKIPLHRTKDFASWKNRQTQEPVLSSFFSRVLLLDGVKNCIKDYDKFSRLLVEVITPDVMFNDASWPDEEFLKVTIERDLLICKKYDEHPILWDLTELVAVSGHLQNCTPLIRALMAVQMTRWASRASNEILEKNALESSQKLLSLMAKADFIPFVPFKYVPSILPKLNSWQIYCVLSDVWKLIRDSTLDSSSKPTSLKPYLERLRVILSHKCPGPVFVKIFRGIL